MAAESEQQDTGAVDRVIACLTDALKEAKALKAGESSEDKEETAESKEESAEGETPASKQPTNLKDAEKESRRRFAAARASSSASK